MSHRIVILGAGESGTGAAKLALMKGFDVFVSDSGAIKDKYRTELKELKVDFEEGMHTESKILNATEIIKSPGIPEKAPLIQKIRELKIPVISEIEFAGRYTQARKICITGSNGKTTTTSLIYHILKTAGINVGLAGNVGKSFARMVAEAEHSCYVIELSSFQLDDMYQFRAETAILLNITPDHLDRYNYDFENYIRSKFRIVNNLTPADHFIFFADDEVISKYLSGYNIQARCMPFSLSRKEKMAAYLEKKRVIINHPINPIVMTIDELSLKGRHNVCNSMAAGIAAMIEDISNETIRESLRQFQDVEHRLERFLKIREVEFINDSKATNVNSAWFALECMDKPVVWIVGGVDKGNDYSELSDLVRSKVKAIVCLGKDNSKIIQHFKDMVPLIIETTTMSDAVRKSFQLAQRGDIVLLSPCCASFDLFENYEDRGRQFKECVRNL